MDFEPTTPTETRHTNYVRYGCNELNSLYLLLGILHMAATVHAALLGSGAFGFAATIW